MRAQLRILGFIGVMLLITASVTAIAVGLLYRAALDGQRERLREIAQARARIIEAVAHFDAEHAGRSSPEDALAASLSQIREAHQRFTGFGRTGEFTLARRRGDEIVFLLSHRHEHPGDRESVPFDSELAEPMRHALSGESGTLVGLDYRGATVLAAYEPIGIYDLGVVAKIDLAEVRAPFVRAGIVAAVFGLVLVVLGGWVIVEIGNPLVRDLRRTVQRLETEVEEHRRSRAALAESEEQARALIERSPLAKMVVEPDGSVSHVNAMLTRVLGYRRGDVPTLADWWRTALPDDEDRERAETAFARFLEAVDDEAGQPVPVLVEATCRDGSPRWLELSGSRIGDQTLVVFADVTEQRRLEDQLQKAQRLESIGRLSGGVAHDFNNMLMVILSLTSMVLEELPEDSPLRTDLEEIRAAGRRAESLTRQLLAFSRRQVLQPKIIVLNELVGGMDSLLRRLLGEDIDLKTVLADDLDPVRVDPAQMEQVVMNLAVNARDAMPSGGRLTLETANVDLDADYAASHAGVEPGPHVMLAVSDSGAGMDETTRSRIFEPFFTTKEHGKGTGLGLATVYGIVKQSGGHIWLYSEPGEGSTFKIYLPRAERHDHVAPVATETPFVGDHTGVVLLVEDAEQVRHVASRMLESGGYTVIAASSGEEAVRLLDEQPRHVDLLLTDVVMPGMSGRQTADAIQKRHPDIVVLFMSGYTENAIVHHGVLDDNTHFIQKPFARGQLLHKVREVLGETRG